MFEPKRDDHPMVIKETAGTKAYCQCGLSDNLPYCDGSHARENTGLRPCVVEVDAPGKKAICRCYGSGQLPWCDGSHAKTT